MSGLESHSAPLQGLFPLVACRSCQARRIAYGDLAGDELGFRCFFCHDFGALAGYTDAQEYALLGLEVVAAGAIEPPLPKKKGCAKGCGSGSCGTRAPGKNASDKTDKSAGGCSGCATGGCGVKKA